MTRATNARIAGSAYFVYMAVGISNEFLMNRATSAEGTAALLARMGEHATDMRVAILCKLLECFSAMVIGVALYGITRDEDHELAMLGLICRLAEAVMIGAILIPNNLGLLRFAQTLAGGGVPDIATANALGALLETPVGLIGAIFFAVGSTIFSWLLLRGRMIPVSLALLGVFSSAVLAVGLPLQFTGFFTGPLTDYQWLPEIAFSVVLALWLLIKGVAMPENVA